MKTPLIAGAIAIMALVGFSAQAANADTRGPAGWSSPTHTRYSTTTQQAPTQQQTSPTQQAPTQNSSTPTEEAIMTLAMVSGTVDRNAGISFHDFCNAGVFVTTTGTRISISFGSNYFEFYSGRGTGTNGAQYAVTTVLYITAAYTTSTFRFWVSPPWKSGFRSFDSRRQTQIPPQCG